MYFRINAAKFVKENKTMKSAAKKLVKKKMLKIDDPERLKLVLRTCVRVPFTGGKV